MSVAVLSTTRRPITAASLYELHRAVAWWPQRSEEDYAFVLRTCLAVGAWNDSALIGLARAISDGRLHAYVDDVMVDPGWRRQGIAVRLVDTLIDALDGVPVITLFCGAELVPLYERSSFVSTRQVVLHRQRRADDSSLVGLAGGGLVAGVSCGRLTRRTSPVGRRDRRRGQRTK